MCVRVKICLFDQYMVSYSGVHEARRSFFTRELVILFSAARIFSIVIFILFVIVIILWARTFVVKLAGGEKITI